MRHTLNETIRANIYSTFVPKVTDTNPVGASLAGQFSDVSQVEKFEISEQEYARRQGSTVLAHLFSIGYSDYLYSWTFRYTPRIQAAQQARALCRR